MKYRLHVDAKKDLQEATYYYTSVSPSLAYDFLAEIEECISRILTFPEAWTPLPRSQKVPHKSLSLWLDLSKKGRPDFYHGGDAPSSRTGLLGASNLDFSRTWICLRN